MSANPQLVAELTRYRRAHSPARLPTGGVRVAPNGKTNGKTMLAALASASARCLRPIAGNHMIDLQVDLRFVRNNLGHATLVTSSAYLHTEDDAWHAATQELR